MRGLKPPQKRPRSITALSADLQRLRPPVDLSPYATKGYVDDAVAAGGGGGFNFVDDFTVGYWPLGELNANAWAIDATGGLSLSPTLNPGVGDGHLAGSRARVFTGSEYFSTTTGNGALVAASAGSWTVEARVFLTALRAHVPFKIQDNAGSANMLLRLIVDVSGRIRVTWMHDTQALVDETQSAGAAVALNTWTTIGARKTVQADGTCDLDFLIDGAPVETVTGLANCDGLAATTGAWIGRDGSFGSFLQGRMQHLRFSRKARSNDELAAFHANT